MIRPTPPILCLILAALVALGASGCDLWPSSKDTAARDAAKDARPSQAPPPAAQAPATQPSALAALPPPSSPPPPARMTNAQQADFDSWIVKTYLGCWRPSAQPADSDPYVAHVRLAFKPDGSLAKAPKLVNPPSDPALKPQAKSVMQAVQACNPLPVPAQYRPFYEQWKTKTVHFNPQVATR